MVYMPSGSVIIGSEKGLYNEAPVFETEVEAFFIDKHPVTVAQFREFVQATEYVTQAERFGNSALFNYDILQYELIDSVNWEYPLGRDKPKAPDDHPVTHVSWNDANAYAKWQGKRLPSEIEWEYAARNAGKTNTQYSWGQRLVDNKGNYLANTWQGGFPINNTLADGYATTSPVGLFGITVCGLTDMGGNVWEWCNDTYNLYEGNSTFYTVDPEAKVIRGGSFMCDSLVCHGYRVSARQFTTSETSNFHMGFRCAKSVFN